LATFNTSPEYEVKQDIDSPVLQRILALAEPGTFKAYSLCYRHPRFKSKLSPLHFYASFRFEGKRHGADGKTMGELEAELTQYYLTPASAA